MISAWLFLYFPLVGIMACWGWYQWKHRRMLGFARQFPTVFPTLPILGHLLYGLPFAADWSKFMSTFLCETTAKRAADLKVDNFCIWTGPFPLVCIQSLDDIKIILNSSKTLEKGPEYGCLDFIIDDTSTLLAKRDIWRPTRRGLDPVFHPRNLALLLPRINTNARNLVKTLTLGGRDEFVDVLPDALPLTVFNLKDITFGQHVRVDSDTANHIVNHVNLIFKLWGKRFLKYYTMFDLKWLFERYYQQEIEKVQCDGRIITNPAVEIFNSRQRDSYYMTKDSVERPEGPAVPEPLSLLDVYLSPPETHTSLFTARSLYTNIYTITAAGLKTSSLFLSTCLLMLAIHPEVQEKLYEEVMSVMGEQDRDVTWEDLQEMTYLEQVLKEAARMYPGFPIMGRKVTEDLKLTSTTAPAGTILYVFMYGVHRSPHNYINPDVFDPDRFSTESSAARHKYSFIAFGGGPRNCIGKDFVMMATKTTVVQVVKSLRLKTNIKMEYIQLSYSVEMFRKEGYPISAERRGTFTSE